jgi:hypothetical protein
MKLKLLYYAVFSVSFILIFNLTIGLYYHEWEIMVNSFFSFEYTSIVDFSFTSPVWFLIAPILSYLSAVFEFSFFPLAYVLFLIGNLTATLTLSNIYLKANDSKSSFFVQILILASLFPLIFFVSNKSLVIWLCFNISFLYYHGYQIKNKKLKSLAYLLLALAILIRFDMVLLYSVFLIVFSLFFDKSLFNIGMVFLLTALIFTLCFELLSYNYFNEYYFVERAERIMLDKGLLSKAILDEDYKTIAVCRYMQDKEIIDDEVYKNIVTNFSFKSYFFSKTFVYAYFDNCLEFFRDASKYKFYVGIILFVFLFYLKRKHSIKVTLFFLMIISTPFVLAPFFKVPAVFWHSILSVVFIIYLLINQRKISNNKSLLIILFSIASIGFLTENYRIERKKAIKSHNYRETIQLLDRHNKITVFSFWAQDFENLDNRLEFTMEASRIEHYYLDYFFFSRYNFVKDKHQLFFNNQYEYLIEKLKICETRELAVFIDEDYHFFLNNYLSSNHNTSIFLEEFDFIDYSLLKKNEVHSLPYKISLQSKSSKN